ncbi:putative orphan protein [Pseudoalteromonas translucida]|uniref:Orphan protein n=1 Tax=Pseudoalteromonas translucida (strain TAC 125) TaxID=326442 RepID=Q3IKB0_PSET1|nr:putative orphan protein [Pseudoalteromonas translucida]
MQRTDAATLLISPQRIKAMPKPRVARSAIVRFALPKNQAKLAFSYAIALIYTAYKLNIIY